MYRRIMLLLSLSENLGRDEEVLASSAWSQETVRQGGLDDLLYHCTAGTAWLLVDDDNKEDAKRVIRSGGENK